MASCSLFLYLEATNIISLLFGYGKFSAQDVVATSKALKCFSFAAVGYGLIKVMTSFYYALDKTKFAMYVSVLSIFVNFVSNYYLSQKIGYVGLALTSSITLSLNALILFVISLRLGVRIDIKVFSVKIITLLCALILCFLGNRLFRSLGLNFSSGKLQNLFELSVSLSIFVLIIGGLSILVFPKFQSFIKSRIS
jgi:putative peptidoglycan lipid II flippase